MECKHYVKKLEKKKGVHKKQLSIGIPNDFAKEYSLEDGKYVFLSAKKDGILIRRLSDNDILCGNPLMEWEIDYEKDFPVPRGFRKEHRS